MESMMSSANLLQLPDPALTAGQSRTYPSPISSNSSMSLEHETELRIEARKVVYHPVTEGESQDN